jgi:hypothetical protein
MLDDDREENGLGGPIEPGCLESHIMSATVVMAWIFRLEHGINMISSLRTMQSGLVQRIVESRCHGHGTGVTVAKTISRVDSGNVASVT